ncbi:MAG: MFS transporter [Ignavibacteriae bacterium]|nr:MFS transporter [Ignavibacteriota bacterium]
MPKKTPLLPILSVTFVSTLGYSIVIPFLVYLVEQYGGNAIIYGVLGAAYPAFQLIGAPILGNWSDIYGRKKILFLSQAGTLISWMLFLVAMLIPVTNLWKVDSGFLGAFSITLPLLLLFLARSFDGLTGGNISVANAYLADITDEKDRNKNYGRMSIASNLGFILGPALAGVLGATALGYYLPVYAAIAISTVATFLIVFYLPDANPCDDGTESIKRTGLRKLFNFEQKECVESRDDRKIKFSTISKLQGIPYVLVLYFLVFLGFSIFYTAFPVHAQQTLKWSVTQLGVYFSVISLFMILVQGPLLTRLSKSFDDSTLALFGAIILGTNFFLLTFTNLVIVYAAAIFFAVGNGIMWPSVLSLLSRLAGKKYQGAVQGFAGSAGSLAGIIGLTLGGILYVQLNSATFIICAVIIYLTFLLSFRLIKLEKGCQSKEDFAKEMNPASVNP